MPLYSPFSVDDEMKRFNPTDRCLGVQYSPCASLLYDCRDGPLHGPDGLADHAADGSSKFSGPPNGGAGLGLPHYFLHVLTGCCGSACRLGLECADRRPCLARETFPLTGNLLRSGGNFRSSAHHYVTSHERLDIIRSIGLDLFNHAVPSCPSTNREFMWALKMSLA